MTTWKYVSVVREYIVELDEYQIRIVPGKKDAGQGMMFFENPDEVGCSASTVKYDVLDEINLGQRLTKDELEEEVKRREIHPDDYPTVPEGESRS